MAEPIIATTVVTLGKVLLPKLTGEAVKYFGTAVIQRWTNFRAERFLEAFNAEVKLENVSGIYSTEVDKRLAAIYEDDLKSDLLFESYRKVCFSASKTLGPRIIGLLTARIVSEGRMANGVEEEVFEAAETLSDDDLTSFIREFRELRSKAEQNDKTYFEYSVKNDSVNVLSKMDPSREEDITGGWAIVNCGNWARKLMQCGLITESVKLEFIEKPFHKTFNVPKTHFSTTVHTTFRTSCDELLTLAIRAQYVGLTQ